MNDGPVDLAALQAEIRERVQRKRANGAYSDDVRAALELPLPGGRALFSEELGDPLPALQDTLAEEVAYDARSHRRFVGGAITFGRRVAIGLVRWWIAAITDRQERINQLLARAVIDLRDAPSPQFDERLSRLEREWRRRNDDEVAASLESRFFAARFSGDEQVIRRQSEAFVDLFRGRTRVLDLGSGRGTFLELLRDTGIGGYGVDPDAKMNEDVRGRGLDARSEDGLSHLRSLGDASIGPARRSCSSRPTRRRSPSARTRSGSIRSTAGRSRPTSSTSTSRSRASTASRRARPSRARRASTRAFPKGRSATT